jgi:hypothetical protein
MIIFYLRIITFALLFLASINLTAQQNIYPPNSPEWLVDMFFKQDKFPDKERYLTGELLQDLEYPTIGEELHGSAIVSFRKITLKTNSAVYGVDIRGNGSNAVFYCYMMNSTGNWKINAIRKFQLPKFIYTVADSLSRISKLSESDQSLLASIKLITGRDEYLKSYLSNNINDFYKLTKAFENDEKDILKLVMDKLNLDYVYLDELHPGCIFVQVSGFKRIECGYIYSLNSATVPKISPARFILIEEVLPNWFVYRAM